MTPDERLASLLELELVDYVGDDAGWARQAARQVVAAARLAGWAPVAGAVIPAEEEPKGCR